MVRKRKLTSVFRPSSWSRCRTRHALRSLGTKRAPGYSRREVIGTSLRGWRSCRVGVRYHAISDGGKAMITSSGEGKLVKGVDLRTPVANHRFKDSR